MTRTFFPGYRPPGGRRAPTDFTRRLREIHPEAELLYGGRGVWLLGKYRPNRDIQRRAERGIAHLERALGKAGQGSIVIPPMVKREIAFRFWWWHLIRMGFRPVTRYPSPGNQIFGEPPGWIVEDFRRRQWRADHELTTTLEQREEEWDSDADLEKAQGRLRGYLEEMHRDIHRHAFRRPHINIPSQRKEVIHAP